jgi:AcrR family transcriptional regulator
MARADRTDGVRQQRPQARERLVGDIYDQRVPPDASETRERLLDAAAREFAEHGVWNASLIEVTRRAGQRNRAALRYHFGPREAVLCAVIDRHVEFLARREGELLAEAQHTPDDDLGAVVEAIVRPAAELAASGWRGRACLLIIAELAGENPARFSPELQTVLDRTGGYEVYALIEARMPEMRAELKVERLGLITAFILRAIADRARALERGKRAARVQLDAETFVANLVAMVAAALSGGSP